MVANKSRFVLLIIGVIPLLGPRVYSAPLPFCEECAPFIPGAVAYWPMTMETKGSDLSRNNNHATFVGLTYTDGPTGEDNGAVHFSGGSNSYASVINSPSIDVGKYPGFSFSGFVRLNIHFEAASLIDWSSSDGYGVFILGYPIIQLHLYPTLNRDVVKHKAEFPDHKLTNGTWHFMGLSYEKYTGRAIAFNNGKQEVIQLDKNIVAGTDKTSDVGLGVDMSNMGFNYHGDMSCMMLFQYALTAEDMNRVWDFCRRTNSANEMLPGITVSDIATTNATVSWTKSPGIFSGYNITIERKQEELGQEIVHPYFISSSATIRKSVLTNLVPGAMYRVHVWHMQEHMQGHMQRHIKGRARSSEWFQTAPSLVVDSDSIIFSEITATSAKVSWKDVTGNYEGYSVDISPATGGARADPSTVPRGTTTTSLMNLTPMTYYTIMIRATIGFKRISPSTKSFYTPEPSVVVESDSIIFSEITSTSAKVSWKGVTGDYDGYSVDISPTTGGAKTDPSTVPRGTTTTSLLNLAAGRSYIVQIRTKIGSRTSSPSVRAFQTLEPDVVVDSDSIIFSEITAISAKVTWKDVTGNHDGYSVDISPTTGGAKAEPSSVPRGTTTTTLLNLTAGRSYMVRIRTKIGSRRNLPSTNVFHTLGLSSATPSSVPTNLIIFVIFALVLVIVVIIAVVLIVRWRTRFRSTNGSNKQESVEMMPQNSKHRKAAKIELLSPRKYVIDSYRENVPMLEITKGAIDIMGDELKKRYQVDYRNILFLPYRQDRVTDITQLSRNFKKDTIRGYEDVTLENIFEEVDSYHTSNRYVLEALPGYGKSSIMKKLAYMWATGEEKLNHHFKLVFLINTDDFVEFQKKATNSTGEPLSDFVSSDYFFSDQSIESCHKRDEIWRLIAANEENVLFIIDTNYKSKLPVDLNTLLRRRTMRGSTVILTCRANQVPIMIRNHSNQFRFIRIAKHHPATIQRHILDYSDSQGEGEMGKVLVHKLGIENMDYKKIRDDVKLSWITTPFMLAIITNVWQDIWETGKEDEIGRFCLDEPYIYQKVVKNIFKYYEWLEGEISFRVNHTADTPPAQETHFLGKLAWYMIEKNNSSIPAETLGSLKDDEANLLRNIGFLEPIMIHVDGIAMENYMFTDEIWKFYFAARFLRYESKQWKVNDEAIQNAVERVRILNKNIDGLFKKFINLPM